MRHFGAVVIPIAITFLFWSVITVIPMPGIVLLVLVVGSGVLMPLGMVYLGAKKGDKP